MAQLTAEQIFGADGRERIRELVQQTRDAKADLERAKRAGVDVTTQQQELEAAEKQLLAIQREYYPGLSVPAA